MEQLILVNDLITNKNENEKIQLGLIHWKHPYVSSGAISTDVFLLTVVIKFLSVEMIFDWPTQKLSNNRYSCVSRGDIEIHAKCDFFRRFADWQWSKKYTLRMEWVSDHVFSEHTFHRQ